jgi:hypothetical protein
VVQCAQASAGTRDGTSGKKRGQAALPWAFSEAAGLLRRHHPAGQKALARLENTPGQGKALTVLAHTWARAVYSRFTRDPAGALEKFFTGERAERASPRPPWTPLGSAWEPCACKAEGAASWNASEPGGPPP